MPPLQGEFLSGRKAVLPDAAKGKVALYLIGFSYESRFAVEAWAARYKIDFAANPGINFYEVPVIGGMGILAKPFINRGMRNGTPTQFHENVLTVYGGAGDLRKAFTATSEKFDDKFTVLVLCDTQGLVQWSWAGLFEEAKYLDLKRLAIKLLTK